MEHEFGGCDEEAEISLNHGELLPFDCKPGDEVRVYPSKDWAQYAARGIVAFMLESREFKWVLNAKLPEQQHRVDFVATLTDIIRLAHSERAAEQGPALKN